MKKMLQQWLAGWARCAMVAALALCVCQSAPAQDSGSKKFMNSLLQKGAEIVQKKINEKSPAADISGASAAPAAGDSASNLISHVINDALDQTLTSMKIEGRDIARQVGDVLAERILASPKVQQALETIKLLGWAIIVYLVLVTFSLLGSMRSLKKSNKRILELLERRK